MWRGRSGSVTIAPLFLLYDYTFRTNSLETKERSPAGARESGVYSDESILIMVNHFPVIREPAQLLRYPEFALWYGTDRTADWRRRFHASVVVYGHLHISRTAWYNGVRFEEVSIGYPQERRLPGFLSIEFRQVLPAVERP